MNKIFLFIIIMFVCTACERKEVDYGDIYPDNPSVNLAVGDKVDVKEEEKDFTSLDDIDADIDITTMTKALAFAQANQLLFDGEMYIGETVKVKGVYFKQYIKAYDVTTNFIILLDETSCCQAFVAFELPDGVKYPDEYTEIMIVGEFTEVEQDIDDFYKANYVLVTDFVY